MKYTLLLLSILVTACASTQKKIGVMNDTVTSAVNKPNIIIILEDDAGYSDFGFIGSANLQIP